MRSYGISQSSYYNRQTDQADQTGQSDRPDRQIDRTTEECWSATCGTSPTSSASTICTSRTRRRGGWLIWHRPIIICFTHLAFANHLIRHMRYFALHVFVHDRVVHTVMGLIEEAPCLPKTSTALSASTVFYDGVLHFDHRVLLVLCDGHYYPYCPWCNKRASREHLASANCKGPPTTVVFDAYWGVRPLDGQAERQD